MLTACGGSQSPIGAPGAMPQTTANAKPADRGKSWMKPGTSSGSDLLYASDGGDVLVFSYPGGELVGQLKPDEGGYGYLCSDGDGDIFLPEYDPVPEILEYAHGGTQPVATLTTPVGAQPIACGVDPTTGDLAVTVGTDSGPGYVAIYEDAQGKPQTYSDSNFYYLAFCGYDDQGDLFIDSGTQLAELPKGSGTFTNITLNKNVGGAQLQWDGKDMTVADYYRSAIYRVKVSGSRAKTVGETRFSGQKDHRGWQSWIQGGTVIKPSGELGHTVGLWNYPTGGKAFDTLSGWKYTILGVTVSVGQSR